MYDWKTTDIWTAVARFDLKYNQIYEQLYKNGVPLSEQRLCQPYGDDQRKSLDQFRALEYETWERVLQRVHGVNFGNIYCRTSVLGMIKTEKPNGMTWQEYTVFLLESLGLYVPELRDHYYHKIKAFFKWYEGKKGISIKFNPKLKIEPKITEIVYCFCFAVGRRYCIPITLLKPMNKIIGEIIIIFNFTFSLTFLS